MSDVEDPPSAAGPQSAAGPAEPVPPIVPIPVPPPNPIVVPTVTYTVTGQVTSPLSASVGAQAVVLIERNVGADVRLVTGTTDTAGHFTLQAAISPLVLAARNKSAPDLQVQVTQAVAGTNGSTVVAASIVRYRASTAEELDVVLPSTARIPSEFENLLADIEAVYPGALNAVQETDTRPDITFLANKTGWDARAVAMAAASAQFATPPTNPTAAAEAVAGAPSSDPEPQAQAAPSVPLPAVHPGYYYALMRAGLAELVPNIVEVRRWSPA